MKAILIVLVTLAGICCGGAAENEIHATLEPQTNRPGWFVLHITNVSSNVVPFLDIPEGSGYCGDFYEVTCEKNGKRASSLGKTLYQPAIPPQVVAIAPGKTYDREIQPIAYLYEAKGVSAREITVTYRLSARVEDSWARRANGANLALTFHTGIAGNAPNPQGGANGRQPSTSETNRTPAAAASRRSP